MTTTFTPQTKHSVIITSAVKQTGPALSAGMAIGLLLALTYSATMGSTPLSAQSRNSVTLTPQSRN